ncbi:MAG: hypothetical protein FD123_3116 [Bacteroidetes bacterium]|nr:MAG: hypothetical protein FD123_3116 [Bacteroidota bacterium]
MENARPPWIPEKIIRYENELLLRWRFTGDKIFSEPFFEDTITQFRNLRENQSAFQSLSGIGFLSDVREFPETAAPSAVIFHVSRCGSTLFSQLLSLDEKNIVLAEVPVFNQLLYLENRDASERQKLFRAAVNFYGQKRSGLEKRVFIKTDCWHIHDAAFYRAVFPAVPFVFLYRDPAAVIHSHRKRRGMHFVPGLVPQPVKHAGENLDLYSARVLAAYYNAGLDWFANDGNTLLVNYSEGLLNGLMRLLQTIAAEPDAALYKRMQERSAYHSKRPGETFMADNKITLPSDQPYAEAQAFYEKLETARKPAIPVA